MFAGTSSSSSSTKQQQHQTVPSVHILRMCLGPTGARFRDELQDFACLSPGMCIEYRLRKFQRHPPLRIPSSVGADCLTEKIVIGTAMRVGEDRWTRPQAVSSSRIVSRKHTAGDKPVSAPTANATLHGYKATNAGCARMRRLPNVSLMA